jgi:alpha-glucosidase (family GH31 glycosyl hydrolase)
LDKPNDQLHDGDFAPNPACYPSVKALSDGVRKAINATTMFSFWPEVMASSPEYPVLKSRGCLINGDLGGLAFDATIPECRDFVWSTMLKPRYYDQVSGLPSVARLGHTAPKCAP